MANHKTGKPMVSNFPRLKEGGWERIDVKGMIAKANDSGIGTERLAQPGFDPEALYGLCLETMSCWEEVAGMLSDRYVIDRDAAKAAFIKANADRFIDPAKFLEEEE